MKIENRREEFGKKNFTTTVFVSARSNEKKFNDASFLGEKQSSRSNNNNKKKTFTHLQGTHIHNFSQISSLFVVFVFVVVVVVVAVCFFLCSFFFSLFVKCVHVQCLSIARDFFSKIFVVLLLRLVCSVLGIYFFNIHICI